MNVGTDEHRLKQLESALAREKEKVAALQDIGVTLARALEVERVIPTLLRRIAKVIHARAAILYLVDTEHHNRLWSKPSFGAPSDNFFVKVGEGIVGRVAELGHPLGGRFESVLPPPPDEPPNKQRMAASHSAQSQTYHSTLCVPVKSHDGTIVGVVQVVDKDDGFFNADDEGLLLSLASQIGICVENTQLFSSLLSKNDELQKTQIELRRSLEELDVLFEIAQISARSNQIDELLEGVLAQTMRAMHVDAGAILLTDERTGDLRFRCAVGGEAEGVKRLTVAPGKGIVGWVAQHGIPQVVNDVSHDPRHSREIANGLNYHPQSLLCVPLKWEDGVGALELLNKTQADGHFTEDDVKFATVIAGYISTAIGLARAREQRAREDRLSTIGQLISSVLHDLKTPITVISGMVQMMLDEPKEEVRRQQAHTVLRQIDLMNAMAKETLAFARGDRELWVRPVYVRKFFTEVLDQLKREFDGQKFSIRLELHDKGTARFDQFKVQRAIQNIARNAAEALIGRPDGEFVMTVSRRAEDQAMVLDFVDNGPGIPKEVSGRLFESFASFGKAEGTGLGLAIVKKIVDDHHGTVEVSSVPGRTAFTIILPQATQMSVAKSTPEKQQQRKRAVA